MKNRAGSGVKLNIPPFVFLILVFVFAGIFTFNNIFEGDTLWHLKLGQEMIRTHGFLYRDVFSYTFAGTRIYPVEWLFEVVWYALYSVSGISGVIIAKSVVAGLTALFLGFAFEQDATSRYAGLLIITGIYVISGSYFVDRPQIITYLGISLLVFIMSLPDTRAKKVLWFVPVIILIWVNMHPGVVFGIIFLIAWFMEGFIYLLKRSIEPPVFYTRLSILVLSLAATLITPNTYHLYTFLFHHVASLGQKGGLEYIAEFLPPSLSQTPVMLVGLAVFSVIFILGIFRMPLRYVLYGLVLIPMSFDMRRMVIMALIGIAPGIGLVVQGWLARLGRLHIPAVPVNILCAAVLLSPFLYEYNQYRTDYVGYKGIGIQKQFYPKRAIEFILDHHIQGNIYNSINFGGAVIFLGYPKIKDFIDTRLDPERMLLPEVVQAMNSPQAFNSLLDRYNISSALVETYVPVNYPWLLPAPQWRLVYFDDYAQIYVKQGTGNDALIENYGYTVFNPYTFFYTLAPYLSPDSYFTQPGLLKDLHRLVQESPSSAMANLAYGLGLIYNNADYAEGLKYIDTAKRIMPYNPRILLWYGIEQGLNGSTRVMQKSFRMVNTVLQYQEGSTPKDKAFMNFIMGYYDYVAGLRKEAVRRLKKALRFNHDFSQAQALLNRIE